MKAKLRSFVALFVVLATFICFSTSVLAATIEQDGITVTITTDKESYTEDEPISVTISATNTNDYAVSNMKIESIIPEGYKLNENTQSVINKESIQSGETLTLTAIYEGEVSDITVGESPQTGDNFSDIVIISIITILGIGISVLLIKQKKAKKILSLVLCLTVFGTTFLGLNFNVIAASTEEKSITAKEEITVGNNIIPISAIITFKTLEDTDNQTYTRGEWIQDLVTSYEYPEIQRENVTPSYSDIDNTEYEEAIETAVAYGLLDTDNDKFFPEEEATREFAAVTAVRQLGFAPTEAITCSDSDIITYKEEAFIAVQFELLTLENDYFYPNRALTHLEGEQVLNTIQEINNSTELDPNHENVINYRENVIILNDVSDYTINENTLTLPKLNEINNIKKDDIILLNNSEAFKVVTVTNNENNVIVQFVTPEIYEFIESMDIEGQGKADFSQFVPAEGVTVTYNSALDNNIQARSSSIDSGDIEFDPNVSIEMEGEIDLGDGWELGYSVKGKIPSASYKLAFEPQWMPPFINIKNAYAKCDMETEIQVSVGSDRDDIVYPLSKKWSLGTVPILGVDGAGLVLELSLVAEANGQFRLQHNLSGCYGTQIINNQPRSISTFQTSASGGMLGELKVGPKIALKAEMFNQDLLTCSADTGIRVGGELAIRSTGLVCVDADVSAYLKLTLLDACAFGDWLHYKMEQTIWDENSSPIQISGHWENLERVEQCTYETGGTIKGTVVEANNRENYIQNAKIEIYNGSDMSFQQTVYSDENGQYTATMPGGTYLIKVSADGYLPFTSLENVLDKQLIYVESYLMVEGEEGSTETGTIGGYITDSVTGSIVPDVKITIRKGWNTTSGEFVTTTVTDSDGLYQCTLPIGNYTVLMEKGGYITNHINIAVTSGVHLDKNGAIVPDGSSEIPTGDMRIVLTWEDEPRDLDSHLVGPTADENGLFHIYYLDKQYKENDTLYADLDLDDRNSYGPETVTIYNMNRSGTYSYYVHNFSDSNDYDSNRLSNSGAKVKVYFGDTLYATYNVPTNVEGTAWHVFDFNAETQTLQAVNVIVPRLIF